MSTILPIIFLNIVTFQTAFSQYVIPQPSFEFDECEIISVSIPDDGVITLFTFSGNINEIIGKKENGTIYKDVNHPTKGFWTFNDTTTAFNNDDIIYYWLHVVDKSGKDYFQENGTYHVKCEYENNESTTESSRAVPSDCTKSLTTVNGKPTCSGKLVFSEQFNNLKRWETEIKFAGAPYYEFVTYWEEFNCVEAKNGVANFRPLLTEDVFGFLFLYSEEGLDLSFTCTSHLTDECMIKPRQGRIIPPIFSGRINSKPTFSFRYGRVEIKAKLPIGDWIFPQLYLTPKTHNYCPRFNYAEMIIGYTVGNKNLNQELLGGLTFGDDLNGRHDEFRKHVTDGNWNDDFHIFGLEWRPDKVIYSVDGKVYGNIDLPLKNQDVFVPFNQEMIITLGLGVGGQNMPDVEGKPYNNSDTNAMLKFHESNDYLETWNKSRSLLSVDYVKVYTL